MTGWTWPAAIKLVTDRGADVNQPEPQLGMTSLFTAAYNCNKDNVQALLDAGASWRIADRNWKKDALGIAAMKAEEGQADCQAVFGAIFAKAVAARDPQVLATVTSWCARLDILATGLRVESRSLEDVFLDITGKELRS